MKDVSTPNITTNARMYISSATAPSSMISPPATSATSETLSRTFHPLYIRAPRTIPIPSESRILLVAIARPIATTGGSRERIDGSIRSEEHTSELQSRQYLVCRLLLEKKKRLVTTVHS